MLAVSNKPIFIQLADEIKSRIIDGKLQIDDKIPSVRELAATFEVNNNTSMHTIEVLARENIIYQKRGMGYFVTKEAVDIIKSQKEEQFLSEFVPVLKNTMALLGITPQQLVEILNKEGEK
ncbi:MAG: GntR family transcriptional regulator [Bacteroidales bacterium]|nr:GntR family transcriptional regulator [Bacteroidales bacterium]